ncbi:MAG: hypothetical protein P9M14_05240 [Candidatus Alcyoniella australis]|nr:hypothetical protein [Candidatus Alcyoniella australis]
MDAVQAASTFDMALQVLKAFGLPGIILIIWYFDHRKIDAYRQMVKQDGQLLVEIRDALLMFTREMTRLQQKVDDNQFCPMVKRETRG